MQINNFLRKEEEKGEETTQINLCNKRNMYRPRFAVFSYVTSASLVIIYLSDLSSHDDLDVMAIFVSPIT